MIAVSFLKSKKTLKETIKDINDSKAAMIHVDFMDGTYVSEKSCSLDELKEALKRNTKLLDVHLMVNNPLKYISFFSKLNTYTITFHIDCKDNIESVIKRIKKYNINVGIALNPNQNISLLDKYINDINYVLIMSVYPGKGGQSFLKEVVTKIKKLQKEDIMIGIDGGINKDTIKYLRKLKIDNIISGSYICMSDNYDERIDSLVEKMVTNEK